MAVPFDNHGWLSVVQHQAYGRRRARPRTCCRQNGTEFIEWAQKITTDVNGKHPNEEGFDKDNVDVWAIDCTWPRFTVPTTLWQFGGGVVSDDGTTATLDSPESVAAVQYWQDLMYKYYVSPADHARHDVGRRRLQEQPDRVFCGKARGPAASCATTRTWQR